MIKKRYVLCPGYIRSKTDGDIHYITAGQLIKLYRVNPQECIIDSMTLRGYDTENLIYLRPRYDGNYVIPEDTNNEN